jgi:YgiT-type zinc finger domain-containing protein
MKILKQGGNHKMRCAECGKDMIEKERTYVANLESCVIIVKHVPAYVCECGAVYYNDEVCERLEEIISNLRHLINDIAVVDYNKAA